MSEETKIYVAGANRRAKRLFEETRNPYWILRSLQLTKNFFAPSDWAVQALVRAAAKAMEDHEKGGVELSIDRVLGLRTKRGGTPSSKKAVAEDKLDEVLARIAILHAYYEISKETACEALYHSVDVVHASNLDFVTTEAAHGELAGFNPSGNRVKYGADGRGALRELLEKMEKFDSSPLRIQERTKIWSTTFAETLGCSLDTLIAKAHRKRNFSDFLGNKQDITKYLSHLMIQYSNYFGEEVMPRGLNARRWRGIDVASMRIRKDVAEFRDWMYRDR